MHKPRKLFYIIYVIIILIVACSSIFLLKENVSPKLMKKQPTLSLNGKHLSEKTELPEMPDKKEVREITLSAIGDVLIHKRVYDVAETNDGYDFMPMLENVTPYLNDTTITFANQESIIGGEELGLSTYPAFNSPQEVGDALRENGVDIVSMANNHTLDRGEEAIQSAIRHWEDLGMMYTGAYKNKEDRSSIRVVETDEGMNVAFLAYTYGTNGIQVPEGKEYLVNYIDKKQMKKDIKEAQQKADVTVLSLHFGTEYERLPNVEQEDLVRFMADEGVDIVLGHHPHVLQPPEWIEGKDGQEMFAIYSLGNFISGQDDYYTRVGGVLQLTIQQTIENNASTIDVTNPSFLPTYVDIDDDYKVFPMFQLTDDRLSGVKKHYREIQDHMSQKMPELEFIEK